MYVQLPDFQVHQIKKNVYIAMLFFRDPKSYVSFDTKLKFHVFSNNFRFFRDFFIYFYFPFFLLFFDKDLKNIFY